MTLIAAAVMVLLLGLWMLVGVWDNWRYPRINKDIVAQVMRLERMEQDYPNEFARVAHRRVSSESHISVAFWMVCLWESLATILLLIGAVLLGSASMNGADPETARNVALAGALVFTSNWAGFLIGGNYFLYYFCHFEGQFTHFLLLIWGAVVVTMLTLM